MSIPRFLANRPPAERPTAAPRGWRLERRPSAVVGAPWEPLVLSADSREDALADFDLPAARRPLDVLRLWSPFRPGGNAEGYWFVRDDGGGPVPLPRLDGGGRRRPASAPFFVEHSRDNWPDFWEMDVTGSDLAWVAHSLVRRGSLSRKALGRPLVEFVRQAREASPDKPLGSYALLWEGLAAVDAWLAGPDELPAESPLGVLARGYGREVLRGTPFPPEVTAAYWLAEFARGADPAGEDAPQALCRALVRAVEDVAGRSAADARHADGLRAALPLPALLLAATDPEFPADGEGP